MACDLLHQQATILSRALVSNRGIGLMRALNDCKTTIMRRRRKQHSMAKGRYGRPWSPASQTWLNTSMPPHSHTDKTQRFRVIIVTGEATPHCQNLVASDRSTVILRRVFDVTPTQNSMRPWTGQNSPHQ
jgi:hypothetical protein